MLRQSWLPSRSKNSGVELINPKGPIWYRDPNSQVGRTGKKVRNKVTGKVIVVLGCKPYQKDGSISPELKSRVGKGVELYQRGFGEKIIFTGGCVFSNIPEAAIMKSLAGMIPKSDMLLELHAKSTVENALFSKRILIQKGLHSIILVTSPYHLKRALRIFDGVFGKSFELTGIQSDFDLRWPRSWWLPMIEWAKWINLAPKRALQRLGS